MTDNEDFFGDYLPDTTDTESNTAKVVQTFKELMSAQEDFDATAEVLEGLKSKISKIKGETFPDLLREMGTEIWRDPETGITIELETSVNAALPKDREKRNEVLNALRPIGIEEILGEEFNAVFIPKDKRVPVLRRLLGLPDPVVEVAVLEDDAEAPAEPRLTNAQIAAIEDFRAAFDFGSMPAEEKLGVHPSRLAAWLKRQIDAGKGTEIRDAGIWHGKVAKVNKPTAKKGKKA